MLLATVLQCESDCQVVLESAVSDGGDVMRAKSSIVAHMWRTEADPRNFDFRRKVFQFLLQGCQLISKLSAVT